MAASARGRGHGRRTVPRVALLTRAGVRAVALDGARVATGAGSLHRGHDELVGSVAGRAALVRRRTCTLYEPVVLGVALAAGAAVRYRVPVRSVASQASLPPMLWRSAGGELADLGMMAVGTCLDGQLRRRMWVVTAGAVSMAGRGAGEVPLLVLVARGAYGAGGRRTVDVVTLQASPVLRRAASEQRVGLFVVAANATTALRHPVVRDVTTRAAVVL